MSAAPAFAAGWAPEVNTDTLAAIKLPAAPAPAKASPRDGQNYSGAEELLVKEFGVTGITMDIPESEVMRQDIYYSNTFCFEQAMRQALSAVLENYKNPTSPLAKTLGELGALQTPTKSELKKARRKVLKLLNSPSSHISIVRPYKHNQPLAGETVEKNWIFYLNLGGNPYWAIVDRSGEKAPYVYGSN